MFFFTFLNMVFLLSLMCMFPELNGVKFCSRSFHLQISDILQTRTDQSEDHMKINFGQYNNKYHKQLELKKEMKKVGSFVLFPSFLQIFADLSKKSKSIKAIYISLKDLILLSQKVVCFIGVLSNSSRDNKD